MSYLDELKRQAIHLDLEICVAETRINKILRDAKHWRIQRIGDLGLKPLMAIHAESFRAARKTEELIEIRRKIKRIEQIAEENEA